MSVRLSELAKELGTTKKELLEKLPSLGFELKKSTVDIDDLQADAIRYAIRKSGTRFAPPPVKPAARRPASPVAAKAKPAAKKPPRAESGAQSSYVPVPAPALATVTPPPAEVIVTPAASRVETPPAQPPQHAPVAPPPPAPSMVAAPGTLRIVERASQSPGARPNPGMRPGGGRPAEADSRRALPDQPRTTPKAVRAALPRPGERRGGGGGGRSKSKGGADRSSRNGLSMPLSMPTPMPTGPLKPVNLSEGVTVKELAEKIDVRSRDLIKRLIDRGIYATINHSLERDVALEIARSFGYEATIVSFEEEAVLDDVTIEATAEAVVRPPVVTVMGHVDHGKTSLLDAIRETNVAGGEAGQITQHIGAYQVQKKGRRITFLDTPGHEAFTMMRARGAKVTDIVILVVAADDGVMPQTIEAIHHAKAAQVPIIVAINKIDLPAANPDRVKQRLSDNGLLAEDWGGDTVMVPVSAKKRIGLEDLLDLVLLVADMQNLVANPKRSATGIVLEAKLDKGRGAVATVLVQHGTLRPGDSFIAGASYGKVRAMMDEHGLRVDAAGPSTPVEILGLSSVPKAGDSIQVVSEDWKARQIGSFRQAKLREHELSQRKRLTLGDLYAQISQSQSLELPVVLKGDVQGSVEALSEMLTALSNDKVKVRIIHSGTGAITESDVLLASASNAIMVGFNVRPGRKAVTLAEQEQVDVRLHTIIYSVTDEIKAAMQGLLQPTLKEVVMGHAEVRQIFRVPKVGVVAGCHVQDGRIQRDSQVRLLRDNVVVFEGKLASLRRFKEDTAEVRKDFECGMSIANYQDLKEGDVIEAFKMEKVQQTLT